MPLSVARATVTLPAYWTLVPDGVVNISHMSMQVFLVQEAPVTHTTTNRAILFFYMAPLVLPQLPERAESEPSYAFRMVT